MTDRPLLALLPGGRHPTIVEAFNTAVLAVTCPTCKAKPRQRCAMRFSDGEPHLNRRHHLTRAHKAQTARQLRNGPECARYITP